MFFRKRKKKENKRQIKRIYWQRSVGDALVEFQDGSGAYYFGVLPQELKSVLIADDPSQILPKLIKVYEDGYYDDFYWTDCFSYEDIDRFGSYLNEI